MRIRSIFACLFLVTVTATAAGAAPLGGAGAAAIARAVGNCGNPCVINASTGGRVVDFEDAADAIRSARQRLVIDGFCASSCMTMADRARPRTCITTRAVFAYHQTNLNRPIPLRGDLRGWIMSHGGFPRFGTRPGIMSNQVAQRFFPLCKDRET
jgi:hypothetical protein